MTHRLDSLAAALLERCRGEFTSGSGTAFPPTIADGVDFTGLADPEDNGHHTADDSGIWSSATTT